MYILVINKMSWHIREGLKKNLDVSLYAREEFDDLQMEQIKLGLENGIDVFSYLNPNIDYEEMKRIRLNIEIEKEKIL